MPNGKPAGTPCIHLTDSFACMLFGLPERPAVCASLQALAEMCCGYREQALDYLAELEKQTAPPQLQRYESH